MATSRTDGSKDMGNIVYETPESIRKRWKEAGYGDEEKGLVVSAHTIEFGVTPEPTREGISDEQKKHGIQATVIDAGNKAKKTLRAEELTNEKAAKAAVKSSKDKAKTKKTSTSARKSSEDRHDDRI